MTKIIESEKVFDKIIESRDVTFTFSNDEDALDFKEEMKDRFNFPKNVSKYQVVYGTTETGHPVFVE